MVRLFVLAAAIVWFAACSKNNSTPPDTTPEIKGIMPLSIGNIWYYTKTNYDSATGGIKGTTSDTISIVSKIAVNGVTYYQQFQSSIFINSTSFFVNTDSNTVEKIDSAIQYPFFKRVSFDLQVGTWADTVTSRCKGTNELHAYAGDTTVNGYSGCLKNMVFVSDCTHETFEQWVYYLKPNVGLVRIEHYKIKEPAGFFLDFAEDLKSYHLE